MSNTFYGFYTIEVQRLRIVTLYHKLQLWGLICCSCNSLLLVVTVVQVEELANNKHKYACSNRPHHEIGLCMKLRVNETRKGRGPLQPLMWITTHGKIMLSHKLEFLVTTSPSPGAWSPVCLSVCFHSRPQKQKKMSSTSKSKLGNPKVCNPLKTEKKLNHNHPNLPQENEFPWKNLLKTLKLCHMCLVSKENYGH
jgi:hypothetical protein